MAPETPSQAASPPVAPPGQRWKHRLRFRKDAEMRLVSHHDLMQCFERMLRRASLPFAVTQGFHPLPRLVFAQSLALGVAGLAEVVEIEWTRPQAVTEVMERLTAQAPPGLTILEVKEIEPRSSAQVRRAAYHAHLAEPWRVELAARCQALLNQEQLWVVRSRPKPRRFNLRPLLNELNLNADGLTMWLWVTPNGAARPEEVLSLLGLDAWMEEGGLIERTMLELADEVGADAPPGPLLRQGQLTEETPADACSASGIGPGQDQAPVGNRPLALIPGPLSFDS